MSELSERVRRWREVGETVEFRDRRIHRYRDAGEGPLTVLLHGFPSSSFDWRALVGMLDGANLLAFDFLGFGLSEKPADHVYTLAWQADLVEHLVGEAGADGPVRICAHDMGTSVATELLAREIDGELGFELGPVLLFNGSMVVERASLTWSQKLLRSPVAPLAARLTSEPIFRSQFSSLFSSEHPITPQELEDQWSLLSHDQGHRLGHKLINYVQERIDLAERWHGALRSWEGELAFAWGMQDPVATPAVLEALRELRPQAPVFELPELGHYPQIEAPDRLLGPVREALGPLL